MSKKRKYGNAWKDVKADSSQVAQMDALFDRFVAPAHSSPDTTRPQSDRSAQSDQAEVLSLPQSKAANQTNAVNEQPSEQLATPSASFQTEQAYKSLDATHTASEQRIYSIMYRETISKKVTERRFRVTELMEATGIKSDKTARTAIAGLAKKLSIAIVDAQAGHNFGHRYRVFNPKEIFEARKAADLKIDLQTKEILPPVEPPVMPSVTPPVEPPVNFTDPLRYFLPEGPAVSSLSCDNCGHPLNHDYNINRCDDDRARMRARDISLASDHSDKESELREKMGSIIPGATEEELDRAISDLLLLDVGQIEEWTGNAATLPISPQYFVECKRRLYAASQRDETHAKPAKGGASRRSLKRKVETIAARLREAYVGGNQSLAEFSEALKRACAREGLPYDGDLINEIISRR
jgi:hypothetical protein